MSVVEVDVSPTVRVGVLPVAGLAVPLADVGEPAAEATVAPDWGAGWGPGTTCRSGRDMAPVGVGRPL